MHNGEIALPIGWTRSFIFVERNPASRRGAYLWLCDNAAWKDDLSRSGYGAQLIEVKFGEICATFAEMAGAWRWRVDKTRHYIAQLEDGGLVSFREAGGFPVIKMLGLRVGGDTFQDDDEYPIFLTTGQPQGMPTGYGRRSFSGEIRRSVWAKTDGLCFYCGDPLPENWHVDHKTPVSRGGSDNRSNLVPACRSCNLRKGVRSAAEFRRLARSA